LNDRGIALLAGLILLASISLLALVTASGTVLQRNMAGNFEDKALALQNASIATGFAAAWLISRPIISREAGCQTGCVLPAGIHNPGGLPARPEFESSAWWEANAFEAGFNPVTSEFITTSDSGFEPARWIIEEIHYQETGETRGENVAEGVAYYRILTRGSGRTSRTVAVTEAIYARPWEGDFEAGAYPPDGPPHGFCRQFDRKYDCGKLSWRQRR
jgi:hypothetical protein